MICNIWSVLSKECSTDKDTNNISIFNVLEEVHIFGEPSPDALLPFNGKLVSLWERSDYETPCKGSMELKVYGPDSELIGTPLKCLIDLSVSKRHRTIITISGLPVKIPGRYVFQVEYKDDLNDTIKKAPEIPLDIDFITK